MTRNNLLKVGREIFNMGIPPRDTSRPETEARLIKEMFNKSFSSLDKGHFGCLYWVLADSLFRDNSAPKDIIVAACKGLQLECFSPDQVIHQKGQQVSKYFIVLTGSCLITKAKNAREMGFKSTFATDSVSKDLINNAYVSKGTVKALSSVLVMSIGIALFNQIKEENMLLVVQERIQYLQALHLCSGLKKSLITTLSFYLNFQSYQNKQFVYR